MGRLHHRVSHSVKNYRISRLEEHCLPGGLFVCYALDRLGSISFQVFVKWQTARIELKERVVELGWREKY